MIIQINKTEIRKEEKIGIATRHTYIDIDSEVGQKLIEENNIIIDENFEDEE